MPCGSKRSGREAEEFYVVLEDYLKKRKEKKREESLRFVFIAKKNINAIG